MNKFKRERTVKIEEILLKFKHKGKGLETYQKAEREEYERVINQDNQKSKNFGKTKYKSRSMPKKYI